MFYCLEDKGISIVNYIVQDEGMDYSNLKDSRNKEDLCYQTVSHDLSCAEQTDTITVIANRPSYGISIEMSLARGPIPIPSVYKGDNID
jgi:hypothetical protein